MSTPTRRTIRFLYAATLILFLSACDGSGEATTTSRQREPMAATGVATSSTTTIAVETEPDVQRELDWFVSILNGAEISAEEYENRFTEEFRGRFPYQEGLQQILARLRPEAPFVVVRRSGEGIRGVAVIESATGSQARIVADLDEMSRFAELTIHPADTPTLDDPPVSIDEAFERLAEMGTLRALTAEVVDDRCESGEESGSSEPAPIGSIFKLYALAALGEAVQSGQLGWDDDIVIRDELKSVPSGVLQDRDAGDIVTVLETAELMISISDNTAADHLIDLLGRETIEAVMPDYGNTNADLNIPFLDTRELTALKVGPASGLRIQWLKGDESQRRAILDQISEITPADLPVRDWVDPVDPHLLEWFASPDDLCALAVRLGILADSVPEVGDILEANPGVPPQLGMWDQVWFKGGSEPGLIAAWFVTESRGRTFVTAGSVVNPEERIDSEEAILLFAAVRDLLAP